MGQEELKLFQMPEVAASGAMRVLDHTVNRWFDTFESLQSSLGFDIVAALKANSAHEAPQKESQTWKASWFAKPEPEPEVPRLKFRREGGWSHEQFQGADAAKASVACDGEGVVFSDHEGAERV